MSDCTGTNSCPGVYEMENGDFAVVGEHRNQECYALAHRYGFTLRKGEDVVIVPRHVLRAFVKGWNSE